MNRDLALYQKLKTGETIKIFTDNSYDVEYNGDTIFTGKIEYFRDKADLLMFAYAPPFTNREGDLIEYGTIGFA